MPSSISDHDLPYVVLRIKKERCKLTYMTGRSFKGYAADRFYKDMSRGPFWIVLMMQRTNYMLLTFYSMISWINMHQSK